MQFTDAVAVAGMRRLADGYLVATARSVRTGIQHYAGDEVGKPIAFAGPAFTSFYGAPALWGWLVFLLGTARISALCVNGHMAEPTALVRVLGAFTGIALFAAISLGLLFSWTWPPSLPVYSVLAIFGGFSLCWSIFDVAIPDGQDDADS